MCPDHNCIVLFGTSMAMAALAVAGGGATAPEWPTPRTYALLAAGKHLPTFQLMLYRAPFYGSELTLGGAELRGRCSVRNSLRSVVPGPLAHQVGEYLVTMKREQLRALAKALRQTGFADVHGFRSGVSDEPEDLVSLRYNGSARHVPFLDRVCLGRSHREMLPRRAPFERMWAAVTKVLAQCEFEPLVAVRLELQVPKRAVKGTPLTMDLTYTNVGKYDVLLANPLAPDNKNRDFFYLRILKGPGSGPDSSKRVRFAPKEGIPATRKLRHGERLRLRPQHDVALVHPGRYSISLVATVGWAFPEARAVKDTRERTPASLRHVTGGRVVTNTCDVTVK